MVEQSVVWGAYQIASLLPGDPVRARKVVAMALEIVDKAAVEANGRAQGSTKRSRRSKGTPLKRSR